MSKLFIPLTPAARKTSRYNLIRAFIDILIGDGGDDDFAGYAPENIAQLLADQLAPREYCIKDCSELDYDDYLFLYQLAKSRLLA